MAVASGASSRVTWVPTIAGRDGESDKFSNKSNPLRIARGNVSGQEMARLFNRATEGVTAKLAFHICFGNRFGRSRFGRSRFGRSRFDRSYRPYFPGLLDARADQFVLGFAGRELSELDLWQEYG